MLEIYLLGTGGMVPLPGRHLTSLLVRCEGEAILIDCGEGTQVAIRKAGQGFKQIGTILLTHFHADHVSGLPGLLLTIGNAGREEPLTIVGPSQVEDLVRCLCVIAPQLPFPLRFVELGESGADALPAGELLVSALPVEHWVPCYAYRLDLPRRGKFLPDRARALGVPAAMWSLLQGGEEVMVEGRTISPSQVLGAPRKGLRVCYSTDLRPSPALPDFARGADLFVCEGMYGDPEHLDRALSHRHCLFSEAAAMAKAAEAVELWLTHFSPALPDPGSYLHHAAAIFPNTHVDKTQTVLRYSD